MSLRLHYAVERLSPEGQVLVHRGLRENRSFRGTILELAKTTGEKLSPASLRRYAYATAERWKRPGAAQSSPGNAILLNGGEKRAIQENGVPRSTDQSDKPQSLNSANSALPGSAPPDDALVVRRYRKHYAAERLSPEGLALVHRGLRGNWTYGKIIAQLEQATGERISRSALIEYWRVAEPKWATLREVQDQAAAFVAEIRAGSLSAEDVGSALIAQALFDTREALQSANPIELSREQRERQKVELKKQELAIRTRQVEAAERKLAVLEAKQKAIEQQFAKAVAPENTELTEAEKAKIRSIYGVEEWG